MFENESQQLAAATFYPRCPKTVHSGRGNVSGAGIRVAGLLQGRKGFNPGAGPVNTLATNGRVMSMSGVIVDFDVNSSEEDARLCALIDTFVEMQDSTGQWDAASLDLMVRTAFGPAGERLKQLVFQSQEMAEAFCAFWMSETGLQNTQFPF